MVKAPGGRTGVGFTGWSPNPGWWPAKKEKIIEFRDESCFIHCFVC